MKKHAVKGSPWRAVVVIGTLLACSGAAVGTDVCDRGGPVGLDPAAAAQKSGAPAQARDAIALFMLMAEHERQAREGNMALACFVDNPTPEQLADILNRWGARPPQSGANLRYWIVGSQWNPTGTGTSGSAQGRASALTYSFVPDGTTWFHCDGPNAASDLTARFATAFGATNVDRGREYLRQGLASWRRYSGLSYTEVTDDGVVANGGTIPGVPDPQETTRGTVRIGAVPEGTNGILACNNFPSNTSSIGGDMSINSSYFTASAFTNSSNNYRYFRNVIAHEHGHGTGAGHPVPCDNTKLMEPFINTNFDGMQMDDWRFANRQYGDRFAGNTSAANARDFGDLTAAPQRSVLEPWLSTNGSTGANTSNLDWFKFTIDSPQDVVITVTPNGFDPIQWVGTASNPTHSGASGSYPAGQQGSGCNPDGSGTPTRNALASGNLNLTLYASDGTTIVNSAPAQAAGSAETIDRTAAGPNGQLPAGTYYVHVVDVGPNSSTNQIVQIYNLLIRVADFKAPPKAVAGLHKRCAADMPCFFMGNINSYATEPGSAIVAYQWDFDGDGNSNSPLAQPSFTYVSNGTYQVGLTVIANAAGGNMSHQDVINVTVYNATGLVTNAGSGNQGTTVPVTIDGRNFKGVTSASQVTVSGGDITVLGTPVPNLLGTQITGLSFMIPGGATLGARDVTITNSDGLGGVASGNGVFQVLGPLTNGCCLSDGTCIEVLASDCTNVHGGVVTGATCTPHPCPVSCCLPDGSCVDLSTADCNAQGGTPGAIGSVCVSTMCPQPIIACCFTDGTCQHLTAADCTVAGGTPSAFPSTCTPNSCPQPAGLCCYGSVCLANVLPANCTGANQFFIPGTNCNIAGEYKTPCCKADYNHSGMITVQDLFDYLSAWFAKDITSDINGAVPSGGAAVTVQDLFDFLAAWFAKGCP